MSLPLNPAAEAEKRQRVTLRENLYRYWFYGWLFRQADSGSVLERAAALRHNRVQSKWLPLYMRRWVVGCLVALVSEAACERLSQSAVLSATFAIALSLAFLFLLITGLCWAVLQSGRS
jgi:hypothetical protein